jgi:hypothetical protein
MSEGLVENGRHNSSLFCLQTLRKSPLFRSFTQNQPFISKTPQMKHNKVIRTKYILSNSKTVNWGSHRLVVEKSGLPGLCAVWLGNFLSMFRRNVNSLRHQAYESADGQTTLKTKAVRAFETCGSNHPTDWSRRPPAKNEIFQRCAISRYTSRTSRCTVLSLSLACYTCYKQVSCYDGRCTCRLAADLALPQMSYTKCMQHKAILSGGEEMQIVSLFK